MTKLNWSCTACGMSSSRKFSVQRHIGNYNIHNGEGKVIPFVEYAVGRREGKFQTQLPGTPRSQSRSLFFDRIFDKIAEEVEDLIAKDIAKRIYQDLTIDQTPFNDLKMLAKSKIVKKNYYRFFKESMA